MPQYRIEISPNNRAGCKDSICSKQKAKITKGEIRFGTWVEIQDHGSWAWKHWGCVSGSQLQNLRDECDKGGGEWDFDTIDGYDELMHVNTGSDADIREKIRRCVKQAHIDAEDFKGDPEKNRPGEKGIHLTAMQKAAKAAAAVSEAEDGKPKKAAKRGRKKADDEGEHDEPKAKRSKVAKNAKPSKADEPAPVKKSRGRKAVVKDESDEEEEKEEKAEEVVVEGEEGEEEEEEEEKAARKKSKTKTKVSAKAAVIKSSTKGNGQSAKKAAAGEKSADEKLTPRAKGRRASRSAKA